MGEKKTTPVTVDGVDYNFESMTDEQKLLVNHCLDLDRKISSTQFNLQQLEIGKQTFVKMLKEALEKPVETTVE